MPAFSNESAAFDTRRMLAGLLFLEGSMYTLDAYSTLNSSPWTAESFGGDPQKADACLYYVRHAVVYSSLFTFASGAIAGSYMPLIGSAANNTYLYWLYKRALRRARSSGSTTWQDAGLKKAA